MGTGRLYLSGGSGDFCSLPDLAAYDTAGSIDVRLDVAPDVLNVVQYWISRASTTYLWRFFLSSKALAARIWDSGSTADNLDTGTITANAGDRIHLRAVINFTAGNMEGYFRGAVAAAVNDLDSDSNWTSTASSPDALVAADLKQGTDPIQIGAVGGAPSLAGYLYRALFYHGTNSTGTKQMDVDFTDLSSAEVAAKAFTENSANAATVTINGTGWSYEAGAPPNLMMLGVG